jgi:hypothetical protein
MGKFYLLTLGLGLLCANCFAKIWRVNNNIGIAADFTTLQDAHNGAASGDTIYVESSPTNYGSLTSSKKLTIVGTGYFLAQNQGLQAFTLPAMVGSVTFNAGSAGSIIEGLHLNASVNYAADIIIYVSDVIVRRNYFGNLNGNDTEYNTVGTVYIYASVSNILITQNYSLKVKNNSPSTGILISNNYFTTATHQGSNTTDGILELNPTTVAIIKNNIFRRGTVSTYLCNLSNNIMVNGFLNGQDNLVVNNIASGTQFGNTNGNQQNVDMSTVFEATGLYDAYYKLKVGSPAIGAGYGSTAQNPINAGLYGGTNPYVLSGIPGIPSIYSFSNQPVGSNSDPIDVQIKVRSNN